ncbi:MAG: translation initiation factor IF-3 [Patescibacteria group bacterium]
MRRKYYQINQNIKIDKLRVIDSDGENLGIMDRKEALKKAREENLDLVLITKKADPPVAKILDFHKFITEKKDTRREKEKKEKAQEGKTLRIGPNIGENDLKIKINRAREFFAEGNYVTFEMLFKGRMISHPKIGKEKLEKIKEELSEETEVEKDTTRKGRIMTLVLRPK